MSSGIPSHVERFIHDYITSIEQLEVLLLLQDNPHKTWSAAEVSRVLCRQPASVSDRLEQLRAVELVEVQTGEPPLYCVNAQSRHHQTVRALDVAYKERKDSVIRMIFTRPKDPLKAFSDAFRFRKD